MPSIAVQDAARKNMARNFRKTRRNKEHEENVVTYVDEMRRSCNKVLRKIAKPDLGA